jgi:hypothetical protein
MEFIKANLVYSSGLSIGQDDGSTNKIGLSFVEFREDCARSRFGYGHDAALIGCKGAVSQMKACNSWQARGNRMFMGACLAAPIRGNPQ